MSEGDGLGLGEGLGLGVGEGLGDGTGEGEGEGPGDTLGFGDGGITGPGFGSLHADVRQSSSAMAVMYLFIWFSLTTLEAGQGSSDSVAASTTAPKCPNGTAKRARNQGLLIRRLGGLGAFVSATA
jgi:hypothetical protein